MPTEIQNPPAVSITIDGKPAAQYEAEQSGGLSITRTQGDDLCKRVVAPGRTVEWRGKRYTGGETIYLPPAEANFRGRRRDVMHPEDYETISQRPPTERQTPQQAGQKPQGPDYGAR